ncbi:MAG: hypothetical protein AAFY60_22150, partial [Myxococcota bacterium]
MKKLILALGLLSASACTGEGPTSTPDEPVPDIDPIAVGLPCVDSAECAGLANGECVQLLGGNAPGICTVSGCLDTGCPENSECVDFGASIGVSVCVPQPDFCEVNCAAALECALKIECITEGCCGQGGCPSVCTEAPRAECILNAQ